jgi:sortase B
MIIEKLKRFRDSFRSNKIVRISILTVSAMLLVFSLYEIGSYYFESFITSQDMNKIVQVFNEDATTENASAENAASTENAIKDNAPNVLDKMKPLLEINSDTVGWIKIPNSGVIDYPVLQSDDNEYYLKHDFTRQSKKHGQIFMDYRNNPQNLDANTILYGHNMMDGLMFGVLPKYKNADFAKKCSTIEFGTDYQEYKWQVFAVYVTNIKDNYLITNFASDDDFMKYINTAKKKSLINFNVDVKPGDKILTLSTCTYDFKNARFVVHAKLMEN